MNRFIARETILVTGFDPGPTRTAWATLEVDWPHRPKWVDHGILGTKEAPCTSEKLYGFVHALAPGTIIAIEKPSGFIHEHARGAQLLETANIAGQIKAFAMSTFHRVYEFSAQQWRGHVANKATASDEQIASTLRVLISGMPRTNEHVRDSAGLALAVGMLQKRIDIRGGDSQLSNHAQDGNGNNTTSRAGRGG